jgi:hypothetical protein
MLVGNNRVKIYTIFSVVFGGVCLIAVVWWFVLLAMAGWNLFSIRPIWLGFSLMLIAGLSMSASCVFIYFIMLHKERERNSFLCPICGESCAVKSRFCPNCGSALHAMEE